MADQKRILLKAPIAMAQSSALKKIEHLFYMSTCYGQKNYHNIYDKYKQN